MSRIGHHSGLLVRSALAPCVRSCIDSCLVPYDLTPRPIAFSPLYSFTDSGSTEWKQLGNFEWGITISFQNTFDFTQTVTINYGVGTGVGQYTTITATPLGITQFFMLPNYYMRFNFSDPLSVGYAQSTMTVRNVSDSNVVLATFLVEMLIPV